MAEKPPVESRNPVAALPVGERDSESSIKSTRAFPKDSASTLPNTTLDNKAGLDEPSSPGTSRTPGLLESSEHEIESKAATNDGKKSLRMRPPFAVQIRKYF
jgi:hypothetical protein